MHLYILARGNYDQLNQYIRELLAQKFRRTSMDNIPYTINMMVRPIQLYELAFPQECLLEALSHIQPYDKLPIPESATWAIRKALGLKPINKVVAPSGRVTKGHVKAMGIGLRKDIQLDDGQERI